MEPRHQQIAPKDFQTLLERAIGCAVNIRDINPEGFSRCRRIEWHLSQGRLSIPDYRALLAVVLREEAKVPGGFNYRGAVRPQPTADDGLSHLPLRLPFVIADTKAPFSLSDEFCSGGVAIVGGLLTAKSVKAGHLLLVFINHGKSVFAIESKGVGEWDFVAALGYPVLLLTIGAKDSSAFFFNPLTDEGGVDEVYAQLDIFAVCTQRKDSLGLAICAAKHFFETRRAGEKSQLTFAALHRILTTEIVPKTHGHLFQRQLWPSLLNTLESHISGFSGCLNVERGTDFETIIRNHGSLFINTSALSLAQEEYLIAAVGWKLYDTVRRMFPNPVERQTRTVFFVDECSPHLQPKLDQGQRHLGPISELLLKCRAG